MLIVIAMLIAGTVYLVKVRQNSILEKVIAQQGTCFLEDGTCLHQNENSGWYYAIWVFAAAIASLGVYLLYFEKSQKEIISTLEKHKKIQVDDEKFEILMKGLDEDEKKVIKAIKEQDGITQQTLRLRTDLHKSKLSIVLDGLEKKGLLKRIPEGKTNKVFLKIRL